MRSLCLQQHFTKRTSLSRLYLCSKAPTRARESGLLPDPAAVPQAGNRQGQAISITASQPGDKVNEKHDPSRLCCQSALGLEIHNVPILLPDPIAILILPQTHAAEHARHIRCHECARTQPPPGEGVGKLGRDEVGGSGGHILAPILSTQAPPPPKHPPPAK